MMNAEGVLEAPEMVHLQSVGSLDISPSALAEFHEGMTWMEQGDSHRAVKALTRCVEQAPAFTAGHICLGVAHAVSCNVYPAIDHLENAVSLEPRNFAAQYTLAQFYFKLRIPQKGYEHAELALNCVQNGSQRRALAQLLQKERERERNGMSRPWFNRKFGVGFAVAVITGIATFAVLVVAYIR